MTRGGVEPGRRLVEEQQLGITNQGHRHVEPAALAAGQRSGASVAAVAEPDELERLADRPRVWVVAGEPLDQFPGRQLCRQLARSAARCRSAPATRAWEAPDRRRGRSPMPAVAEPIALEDLDHSGLPGAVRPDDR